MLALVLAGAFTTGALAAPRPGGAKPPARKAKPVAPAADSAGGSYASEAAVRHYMNARLLEQSGRLGEALAEYYRALSFDPRAVDLLVRISQVLAQQQEHGRALEFAERALALAPDDWRALWMQGAARFSTGRAADALAPLERACEIDSTQADVLRTTARVAEAVGRADAAERAWRRLVWVDEEDGEAWFQIAEAEARRGDLVAAEQSLQRADELNPSRPGIVFLRAWLKERAGDLGAAIDLYQNHLRLHDRDDATRRRLVALLVRSDRLDDAYAQSKRVIQAEPKDPDVLQVHADLAFKTKHAAEAEKVLAQLQAQQPDDPDNLARAIVVLSRNNRGREAARLADRWIARHPGHVAGPLLSVRAWAAAGVPDSAIARARAAVALAPDSTEPRRLLARTLQDAGRYDQAEREWLELRRRHPEEPGYALDLGGCRERAGNLDGAVAAGREALKLAPDWAPALNFVGYVLADHDRELPEARRLIESALEKDPENGAYVDSHGWVLYRLGRLEEARSQLERAVRLTNGDPVVREHLGDVYRDLKMIAQAREQYELAGTTNAENQKRLAEKLKALD
jgi:tetratricopeptide (TPR) repeat protein